MTLTSRRLLYSLEIILNRVTMKIENAVELKTFPEIEVQSFLLVFRFNFFQLSEKCVNRLP